MSDIYKIDLLLQALQSKRENVAVWGAYHLLSLEDEALVEILPRFLDSHFIDIQEAAVARITAGELEGFSSEVLKLFRESEGQLKYSAACALGILPNDLTKRLLNQWFEHILKGGQSTRMDLDNATYALLKTDPNSFTKILEGLSSFKEEGDKSSILLYNLLAFAEKDEELDLIFDHYFTLRDLHSDVELTYRFLDYFEQSELVNWLSDNISSGYSIQSIYAQCCKLLGETLDQTEKDHLVSLSQIFEHQNDPDALDENEIYLFLENIEKWVERLAYRFPNDAKLNYYRSLTKGFFRNHDLFLKCIPKIINFETCVLLALPLQILTEHKLSYWLADPTSHLNSIANYYNSTLITSVNREKILKLFFSEKQSWTNEEVKIKKSTPQLPKGESKNQVLWSFYRDHYLGVDINWPVVFPNPSYSFRLPEGLARIYAVNFDYYIDQRNQIAIDYALKLFQLYPLKLVKELIVRNFDYLVQKHSELLFQTLELQPAQEYIPLLSAKYRKDEVEIAQLISFMCEIFGMELPTAVEADLLGREKGENLNWKKRIRLNCNVCDHTFQYPVDVIFIDEKKIQQKIPLSNEMIWVPQKFCCKNCSSKVEFKLTQYQLEELTQQSIVDQLLKNTPNYKNTQLRQKIVPIEFPHFNGMTYTPDQFNHLVKKMEQGDLIGSEELLVLYIKQARILKSMMHWQSCLDVLNKQEPDEKLKPEWFFFKGLCCFKLSLWKEARDYFGWLTKNISETEGVDGTYLEQARYFLSEMDSEKSRRSRFKIIEGKKC